MLVALALFLGTPANAETPVVWIPEKVTQRGRGYSATYRIRWSDQQGHHRWSNTFADLDLIHAPVPRGTFQEGMTINEQINAVIGAGSSVAFIGSNYRTRDGELSREQVVLWQGDESPAVEYFEPDYIVPDITAPRGPRLHSTFFNGQPVRVGWTQNGSSQLIYSLIVGTTLVDQGTAIYIEGGLQGKLLWSVQHDGDGAIYSATGDWTLHWGDLSVTKPVINSRDALLCDGFVQFTGESFGRTEYWLIRMSDTVQVTEIPESQAMDAHRSCDPQPDPTWDVMDPAAKTDAMLQRIREAQGRPPTP